MYQLVRFLALLPVGFFLALNVLWIPLLVLIVGLLLLLEVVGRATSAPGTAATGNDTMTCGEFESGDLAGFCDWAGLPADHLFTGLGDFVAAVVAGLEGTLQVPLWFVWMHLAVVVLLSWVAYREATRRQRVKVGALAVERIYVADKSYAESLAGGSHA